MRLSARSGGHCYEGSSVRQELVLDLSGLNHFEWLTDERVCVGSGWTLGQLRPLLQARGRTTIFGSCPSVGLGGFVLGGGFGFLSRSYGLALDLLCRAELVNAEGQGMWVDSDHHPDLFWAIRGGPTGGFGVVTRLELETRPLPEGPVTVFNWRWPLQAAPELSQAWFRWIADAPDELATCLILNGGQAACVASVIGLWLGPGRSLPAWPGCKPCWNGPAPNTTTRAGNDCWNLPPNLLQRRAEPIKTIVTICGRERQRPISRNTLSVFAN